MNVFKDDENEKPIPYDRLTEGQRGFVLKISSRVPKKLRDELMELLATKESIDALELDNFGAPSVPAHLEPALEYFYNLPGQMLEDEENRRLQMYTYARAKKIRGLGNKSKLSEKSFWIKEMDRIEREQDENYLD